MNRRGFGGRLLGSMAGVALTAAAAGTARAASATTAASAPVTSYPARPILLVLPFPPGGSVDVIGRSIAQRLGVRLGQTVVVDNRPGAGGTIGADAVAKAPKDGYTLLLSSSSTHSLAAALRKTLPYDPQRDFAPVIEIASGRSALLVPDSLPVKTVPELLAYLKAHGGENAFGSAGIGTLAHLSGEGFRLATGVELNHVPYKGTALAAQDLAGGRLTLLFDSTVSAQGLARSGKVRILAITGPKRMAALPDVPTLAESGVQILNPQGYFGLWAPAGTPDAVVARLNAAVNEILQTAELRAALLAQSAEPTGGTSAAFAKRVAHDAIAWTQTVQRAGLQPE